jgi:hypothetical protein
MKYLLFLLFLILWVPLSLAQSYYFPYYGKNKVLFEKFDWNSYKTDHFNVLYYVDNPQILKYIAEMAESAYLKISQSVKHALSAPVPLIYYKTYTDFEQTNLLPVSEGILGVSEPILYRVIIYGDMTLEEIQDLIEHELSHIFEFDLLFGSPGGGATAIRYPAGWIMEGWAEYNTDNWSYWSLLIVRDAVLNDRIPELSKSGSLFSRYPLPRPPSYDFGHAMFDFIESNFGKTGIREFWHSLKRSPSSILGRRTPVQKTFKMKHKEFNHEFKKYLRTRFKKFLPRENPENYSIALGPEFPLNPYYFSLSHAVSPSGEIVAVLTVNVRDNDYDLLLISTKDGSVIKNLTKGYSLKYEYIRYDINPSKGKSITWSTDGDRIAFFARSGQKYSLLILDPITGKTQKKINIPFDQPSSPCFSPEGEELLFTAFHEGIHDIFKVNLSTEKFLNLTEDDLFEKAPAISPDGHKVAYTIHLDAYDKLFLSPLNNLKKKTQLTFGKGNTITPQFSSDSKELYFSGDMREAFNIYSLHLETGELKRYTDVRTGNFFPIPDPKDQKTIIFGSFNKGAIQLFRSELEGEVEKTITFTEKLPEKFKRFEPLVSLDINKENIKPFKGMGNLYLMGRPPIDTFISSDGSIYGGSSIRFSDLLGDYIFSLQAYQVRSFRSYDFSYLNQKRRLQFMLRAYHYTLFYYNPYLQYNPLYSNYLTYRDALATRKITGVNFSAYYPFNLYYRASASLSFNNYAEEYYDPTILFQRGSTQQFLNGNLLSASFSIIGETTRFKFPYGPISGNTFAFSISQALPISDAFIQNTTFEADYRHYLPLGSSTLLAFRFNAFASRGKNPFIFYYGGNNQVRSGDYYSIVGTEMWFLNLEFRFPLVSSASTLIGQIGPIRGTLFFDITRAKTGDNPAKLYTYVGPDPDDPFKPPFKISDAIGSYGYGFEFFFLGLPMHLEFARRLEWEDISKPFSYNKWGDFRTRFWIGFDF